MKNCLHNFNDNICTTCGAVKQTEKKKYSLNELENRIRLINNQVYSDIAEELGLETGDTSPESTVEFDNAIHKLAQLLQGWITWNI